MKMTDIDAKVNMSLDEIIKLERKKNGMVNFKGGVKRTRDVNIRAHDGFRGLNKQNLPRFNKIPVWKRSSHKLHGGFVKKKYNKRGGLARSRSISILNRNYKINSKQGLAGNNFGLNQSRSRMNFKFRQGGFFTNRSHLRRTNSVPNLGDPTSVHNRLGYQSPAQIAYRNRVKRAKQLLLQRQNQRMNLQNKFKVIGAVKSLTSLQHRALERQQVLTSQRGFNIGGLRSDQIVRAQYERKLEKLNTVQMNANPNVNFTCTLGSEYSPEIRQRFSSAAGRQSVQNLNMIGSSQQFNRHRRKRSRSRSRNRGIPSMDSILTLDDRSFSKVMYSLSGNLGVTGRTLNDRFSF